MSEREVAAGYPKASLLNADTRARLADRVQRALRRSRSVGRATIASVSARCAAFSDPTAVVAASRRPGEPWFCLEQPDRGGLALAALGCAGVIEAHGAGRFDELAERWQGLAGAAISDAPGSVPGSGLIAVGGFAFAPEGGGLPQWRGFAPGSLVVPELSFARHDGAVWLTANICVTPDDTAEERLGALYRRLGELCAPPLPLLDPAPTGRYEVLSPMPPSHFEEAVARAVQRIRAEELEKVVLAREVEVRAPVDHDPAAVFGLLRQAFPACFVFAVGRGDATFVAASPELLVRSEGQRASTVALAGSARRSADPAVDDHLGQQLLHSEKDRDENAIVARRITQVLRSYAVWVTSAPEPVLVRVANIQHLATPIRAQLAEPLGAIKLAGLLHPTPAVGGEPGELAAQLIPSLEGLDRGWYAGPVGWTDSAGDGEFCVALRCALLRGPVAHCYAGCGIVRDSDPAAELAESEIKLGAMLPVLAG